MLTVILIIISTTTMHVFERCLRNRYYDGTDIRRRQGLAFFMNTPNNSQFAIPL